jgi:glycosyltransferase involved in cell wall biosynthesis
MNGENNKKQVSVVVPAYNEETNIGETLDALLSIKKSSEDNFEIIVVDDASLDKTAEIVKKYDVKLIQHEDNKGYGVSLKTGIHYAQHGIIAIIDADGTYPVDKIPELISFIDDYDMVVGARQFIHLPLIRRPAKWILNKYANYLVKKKIPDLNSGLRVFKKDIYEKFRGILPPGFSFTTTITLAFLSNDYRVKYAPIDYFKRGGKSKIKPIRDTVNFFALVTRASLYFHPLRIYAPISLILLSVGMVSFVYDIYMRDVTDKTMMVFLWGIQFGILGFLADMISRQKK